MRVLPFPAYVGLDDLKRALLVLAVDPSIGGLLIMGPKGTGKSSIVRSFARLLPSTRVVSDCPFRCNPDSPREMCDVCKMRLERGEKLPVAETPMPIVELPIGATEDVVLGTINIERTLKEGRIVFEPGLLGRANRGILYIDEVNLLPDHIVDSILDAAASGWHTVAREGITLRHPARFILIGTMNPEEGELRPQLLDRFAIGVRAETVKDSKLRAEIIKRNIEFDSDPAAFEEKWRPIEEEIRFRILRARELLPYVSVDDLYYELVAKVCSRLEVDGYRPDITAVKVARALAALDGRTRVNEEDLRVGLELALSHRTRAEGLKPPPAKEEIYAAFSEALGKKPTVQKEDVLEKKPQVRFFPRWAY
ncbi:MAG: ATP-binding protein [Thermofilaceae archaeon]